MFLGKFFEPQAKKKKKKKKCTGDPEIGVQTD